MRGIMLGLLLVAGCQSKVGAYVECRGTGAGLSCEVTHREGDQSILVCWDFKATCANGATIVAPGCETVAPGTKTSHFTPEGQFKTLGQCDTVITGSVINLAFNGKPVQ